MSSFARIIAAAALVTAPAAHAHTTTCVAGTAAVAEAQFARFNAAWATRDPDVVTRLFAPGALLLPTLSEVPRTDPAGIRDYFVGFLKGSPQGRVDMSRTYGGCNWAMRAGRWTVTLNDAAGARREVHARFSFLYRRVAGKWLIAHLHSSVDPEGGH